MDVKRETSSLCEWIDDWSYREVPGFFPLPQEALGKNLKRPSVRIGSQLELALGDIFDMPNFGDSSGGNTVLAVRTIRSNALLGLFKYLLHGVACSSDSSNEEIREFGRQIHLSLVCCLSSSHWVLNTLQANAKAEAEWLIARTSLHQQHLFA